MSATSPWCCRARCPAWWAGLGGQRLFQADEAAAASSSSSSSTLATRPFWADTGNTAAGSISRVAATLATWPAISARCRPRCAGPSHRPSILLRATRRPRWRRPALHVVAPHREVALGDAGVGGQDEQHRVGVGQQVEGELGLGADGVEARGVEDHQALLEQRVRKLDDRVAPRGSRPALGVGADAVAACRSGKPSASASARLATRLADLGEACWRLSAELVSRGGSAIRRVALELGDAAALVLRLSMGSRRISGLSPSFHCSSVGHMVVRPRWRAGCGCRSRQRTRR